MNIRSALANPLSPPKRRASRRTFAWLLLAPALAASSINAQAAAAGSAEAGRWITGNGNLEVEIAPCAKGLCGTIVKVLANHSMSEPGKEMKPVDTRPAEGMQILSDFGPADDGTREGQIYNRENGKTYPCLMSMEPNGQLRIRPYIGISWFGKTQLWNRVTDTVGQR